MNCPRCKRKTVIRKARDSEVNVCEGCNGMFLHRGELNKLAKQTMGDLEFSTVDQDSFEHSDVFGPTVCPDCTNAEMKKVEFNIYTNIILDYCENCNGFWLDGQELDRINKEVRELNSAAKEIPDPPMLWFARFIWSLPR